ncbi:MAG: glycine--tRNA ligase [Candidatus Bathyarchaeota archaeon]|nr:glycine--tRNA ligase [Candidatus Bathyarchaeota archaeon]
MKNTDKYEKVIELGRRRGFFWPSYEIYGGAGGFLDFGPAGVALKRKIENKWRDFFLKRHGFLEIETPIITPEKIFRASGHVEHFKDPMIECKICKRVFRADHLLRDLGVKNTESMTLTELRNEFETRGTVCPECGGQLLEPRHMQTMFQTTIGPYTEAIAYGRPEAAQGIFVNFRRLFEVAREQFPIGVGQVGHALRNEISPRQGPIRLREFTIMEFEFFFDPEEPQCPLLKDVQDVEVRVIPIQSRKEKSEEPLQMSLRDAVDRKVILVEWMAYFMGLSQQFIGELGIPQDKQRFLEKLPSERAHYSAQTFDQEIYLDRWGWTEISGHAYRTSYDLSRHMDQSGVDNRVFRPYPRPVEVEEKRLVPDVDAIRKTFGDDFPKVMELVGTVDQGLLEDALTKKGSYEIDGFTITQNHVKAKTLKRKETGKRIVPHVVEPSFGADRLVYSAMEYAYSIKEDRVVLGLPKDIAPFQVVVLPLLKKSDLVEKANKIYRMLLEAKIDTYCDEVGSIGRRYARADEIGVPLAVTVDYETLTDGTLTVRHRDTWKQVRIGQTNLISHTWDFFDSK